MSQSSETIRFHSHTRKPFDSHENLIFDDILKWNSSNDLQSKLFSAFLIHGIEYVIIQNSETQSIGILNCLTSNVYHFARITGSLYQFTRTPISDFTNDETFLKFSKNVVRCEFQHLILNNIMKYFHLLKVLPEEINDVQTNQNTKSLSQFIFNFYFDSNLQILSSQPNTQSSSSKNHRNESIKISFSVGVLVVTISALMFVKAYRSGIR